MDYNLYEGICGIDEVIVAETNTARAYGSGSIEVFATPALCALMEKTSLNSCEKYLTPTCTTVGIEISIKHLKATPIGMNVKCYSKLVKIQGKKLYFYCEAFDNKEKIGEGTHTRYIVNIEEFMNKTNTKGGNCNEK